MRLPWVEKASTADNKFVDPGVSNTLKVTGHIPENLHTDGAYPSPENDRLCELAEINFYSTGMQGAPGRFDLKMTEDGLVVTDTSTGEIIPCQKGLKSSSWRIKTLAGMRYFTAAQIASCERRRAIEALPGDIKKIRNNVEASIFQLSFHLRNNKTRYRGLIKHKLWATMRSLWINFRRIVKWVEKTCANGPERLVDLLYFFIKPAIWYLSLLFDRNVEQIFIDSRNEFILCKNLNN